MATQRADRFGSILWVVSVTPPHVAPRNAETSRQRRSHELLVYLHELRGRSLPRLDAVEMNDPDVRERSTWREEEIWAWIVVACLEPAWFILTEDGDDPAVMLAAIEPEEVAGFARRCWPLRAHRILRAMDAVR